LLLALNSDKEVSGVQFTQQFRTRRDLPGAIFAGLGSRDRFNRPHDGRLVPFSTVRPTRCESDCPKQPVFARLREWYSGFLPVGVWLTLDRDEQVLINRHLQSDPSKTCPARGLSIHLDEGH